MENLINTTELSQYQKQAIDFAKEHNVKMSIKYVKYDYHFTGEKQKRHIYKVTLTRNKKRMSVNFGQSINAGKTEPTLYDVLTCLTKYDCGSFEDFCGDFGYSKYNDECTRENKDSKKIYKACCKEYEAVSRVFGDSDECMEALKEID